MLKDDSGRGRELTWFAHELLARADEIARAAATEVRMRVPGYTAIDESLAEDLRGVIQDVVEALCRSAIAEELVPAKAIGIVREVVARRIRADISLSDWIQAFRVGHGIAWDTTVRLAEEGVLTREAALAAASTMLTYLDRLTTEASEAYLEAQRVDQAERDRVSAELLEDLLGGRPPGTRARAEAAAAAGLLSGGRFVLLVARPISALSDDRRLAAGAATLVRAARLQQPLAVIRNGEVKVVAALSRAGRRPVAGIRRTQAALAEQGLRLAIGISRAKDDLTHVPIAHEEAEVAAGHVNQQGGVASFDELTALDYLTARGAEDPLALDLIPAQVREFVESELAGDGAMLATIRAYADAAMNATEASERLFVHVNTAHYRLRRIHERTGRDIRRTDELVDLLVSIRLLEKHQAMSAAVAIGEAQAAD